jgi:hypothetical protein
MDQLLKSRPMRKRSTAHARRPRPASFEAIADLVGSVKELPADLSAAKKKYLEATDYGRKRPR